MAQYDVVKISYEGKARTVLRQGLNGPCAFIAVVNYIILRYDVRLEDEVDWENTILEEDLFKTIVKSLEISLPKDAIIMKEVLGVLPQLNKKNSLNPYVNSVDGFDKTKETEVINALEIPILHGCIVDVREPETAHAFRGISFRDLVGLTPPLYDKDSDDVRERWKLIEAFMEKTKNQVTSYGLLCIRDHMILQKQKLAVLYRNGEFELMLLKNGTLHILQTNISGEECTKDAPLWQIFCDVDTEDLFVTSSFRPVKAENWPRVLELYIAGTKHFNSLPEQRAKEIFDKRVAESERHATELLNIIEMEMRQNEEKEKKNHARRDKRKNARGGKTTVVLSPSVIPIAPQAGDTSRVVTDEDTPVAPQGGNTSRVVSDEDTAVAPTVGHTHGVILPDDLPVPPIPLSGSFASIMFWKFLNKFDYYERSQTPFFKDEVELMKKRNHFEISINYSDIQHGCDKLAILIRDNFDKVRKDLNDCLTNYLILNCVEKDKADQAILKMVEVPKGYQSFYEYMNENWKNLVDYQEMYGMVISRCTSQLGRRIPRRFLKYIFDKHNSGYCWNGKWLQSDMKVRRGGRKVIITAEAECDVSKEGIRADLMNFVEIMFPWYEDFDEETDIGILPSYFLEFKKQCEEVPDPVSEPQELKKFQTYMASHPAFMAPLATSTLLCHLFTVCDSRLRKYEFIFHPLQDPDVVRADWIGTVSALPEPFQKILVHFGSTYYDPGYWFLLKYLRNFAEHVQRNTKDHPICLDLLNNSLMLGHYLALWITKLLLYIVQNFGVKGMFASAWTHYESSE